MASRANQDALDQQKYLPALSGEGHDIWKYVSEDAQARWRAALASPDAEGQRRGRA